MSRRYWLPLIAVVGLISAAHAQQASKGQSEAPRPAIARQAPQAQSQPAVPVALQHSLDRVGAALEAANKKGETPEEKRKAEEDRQGQLRMADASEVMIYIGGTETAITFFGVLLVLGTLIYTGRAARDAKRSADAAEDALKEARRAANATVGAERDRLRPHDIFLQNLQGTFNAQALLEWDCVYVWFRNGGKSAANVVAISVNRLVTEALPAVPTYNEARAINPAQQHVGASEPWEHISESQDRPDYLIEPNFAAQILADDGLQYWVYGFIDYFNFVGDLERLKFCGQMDLNRLATENYSHLVLGGPEAYTKN